MARHEILEKTHRVDVDLDAQAGGRLHGAHPMLYEILQVDIAIGLDQEPHAEFSAQHVKRGGGGA